MIITITKARTTTDIPLPSMNVEDIIPHGKYKKGFQPLVKSPFIEAYHSLGGHIDSFNNTTADVTSTGPATNSSNQVMTCTLGHYNAQNAVKVNKTVIPLERIDALYPEVKSGGHYVPSCRPRHQVAILVPYTRHRKDNLAVFLLNMHPFLIRQNLEYRIFLLEQSTTTSNIFNKGRLFNAGFIEAMKLGKWKCIIFHDVDLLPLDHRILYTCPETPRHMCARVQEVNDRSYKNHFGGVSALTSEQYKKANGYSNLFWSWGGEDHDMFWRLKKVGLSVVRYSKEIARFTMLPHSQTPKNPNRYRLLKTSTQRQSVEGLSTVDYKVLNMTLHHLYTNILLDINPYKDLINQ